MALIGYIKFIICIIIKIITAILNTFYDDFKSEEMTPGFKIQRDGEGEEDGEGLVKSDDDDPLKCVILS